jgi:hypothetical protein
MPRYAAFTESDTAGPRRMDSSAPMPCEGCVAAEVHGGPAGYPVKTICGSKSLMAISLPMAGREGWLLKTRSFAAQAGLFWV